MGLSTQRITIAVSAASIRAGIFTNAGPPLITANWFTGSQDSAKGIRWFFESCKEADPDSCTFYEDSVEAMEATLNDIYISVLRAPIPIQTDISHGIIDYSVIRTSVSNALYMPLKYWHGLATAPQDLTQGNATTIYAFALGDTPIPNFDCDPSKYEFENHAEGLMAYYCNDGDPVPPDYESAEAHYQASAAYSPIGSPYAGFRIACK